MHRLSRRLLHLWRNLIRKDRMEEQLDAEVRSYVELLAEENRSRGLDPQAARREALIELGGVEQVKESVRDARAGRLLESVWSDVRHAWRMILKMPLTAAVVIGSLGVGIGVNATVFSWIRAVVFEPLPGVSSSGDLKLVEPRAETGSYPGVSWLEYRDLRERLSSFRSLLAFRSVPFNVGESVHTERFYGLLVSGNYFSALGLRPALGRFIQPEDAARPGGERVLVISHEYWQTHFGGSPGVLGQSIRVNDRPLTIIGVAPPQFQGTVLFMNFSFWTPATLAPVLFAGSTELEDRSQRGYSVLGRLAPYVTQAAAQAEFDRAMRQLAQLYPETNAKIQGEVITFWKTPRGPQRLLANSLAILQGVMILLSWAASPLHRRVDSCSPLDEQGDRRFFTDLAKALALAIVERPVDGYGAPNVLTAFALHVQLRVDLDPAALPCFLLHVHPKRCRGAGRETRKDNLKGAGPLSCPPSRGPSSPSRLCVPHRF